MIRSQNGGRASGLRNAAVFLGALVVTTIATAAVAADWPQWRGPQRTGLSSETGLVKSWPTGGPPLVWKGTSLGEAHATVAISKGRVYGMGLRGDDEVVWALDDTTGKEIWAKRIAGRIRVPAQQGGNGPRCTPTVDGTRLYVLGVGGELACLEASNGNIVWQKSLTKEYQSEVPQWGYSESPLVDGEKVIAAPGGRKATVIAFNKNTGAEIWACNTNGDTAHYSSAIAADVDGTRQIIHFLSDGVVGLSAKDGKLLWRYDTPANNIANCSTPLYKDAHVFAASGYSKGGGLAKIGSSSAKEVYSTKAMQNHHGGMVLVGDYIYGYNGNLLECMDFKTGEVKWTAPRGTSVPKGSVVYADGHLIARSEGGRGGMSVIGLIEATPEGYKEKARFEQPEPSGAPAWPYPVVANGKLYIRDMDKLFVFNLRQATARK
jgi:outer membrane protein assembly factor BamB